MTTEVVTRDLPRYAVCCSKWANIGDSVLVVKGRLIDGNLTMTLHRSCLSKAIEVMPLDTSEVEITRRFDGLREAIRESGKLFPEEHYDDNASVRGVAAE